MKETGLYRVRNLASLPGCAIHTYVIVYSFFNNKTKKLTIICCFCRSVMCGGSSHQDENIASRPVCNCCDVTTVRQLFKREYFETV